jgi:hypothetical protein
VGLKTHAKLALVIRQSPEGLRRYVHPGNRAILHRHRTVHRRSGDRLGRGRALQSVDR